MKKALSIFVTLVFALTMVTAAVSANADGLDDVINASALSSIQDVINSSTDEIVLHYCRKRYGNKDSCRKQHNGSYCSAA